MALTNRFEEEAEEEEEEEEADRARADTAAAVLRDEEDDDDPIGEGEVRPPGLVEEDNVDAAAAAEAEEGLEPTPSNALLDRERSKGIPDFRPLVE